MKCIIYFFHVFNCSFEVFKKKKIVMGVLYLRFLQRNSSFKLALY